MSKESKALERQAWDAKRVGNLLLNNALLILMIIAVIYIAVVNPNFLKPASIINILSQTAAYLPAALGIGGCIVLTGTDLSAGRIVGLTACISASLLQSAANLANKMWPEIGTLPIWVVIPVAMLIGAAFGAFNGFFVAKFKLHPFIVTLGTQLIVYTLLLRADGQQQGHGHLQSGRQLYRLCQGRALPRGRHPGAPVCALRRYPDAHHVVHLE